MSCNTSSRWHWMSRDHDWANGSWNLPWYTSLLDYKDVSRTNYAHNPRFYCTSFVGGFAPPFIHVVWPISQPQYLVHWWHLTQIGPIRALLSDFLNWEPERKSTPASWQIREAAMEVSRAMLWKNSSVPWKRMKATLKEKQKSQRRVARHCSYFSSLGWVFVTCNQRVITNIHVIYQFIQKEDK